MKLKEYKKINLISGLLMVEEYQKNLIFKYRKVQKELIWQIDNIKYYIIDMIVYLKNLRLQFILW